ncbi:hypothetical protein [Nonomuraea maritima]|uniref:hypothetical protein n=1 Tax=Nonomuraea maritima TaxID=683260 RepID=UPI003716BB97
MTGSWESFWETAPPPQALSVSAATAGLATYGILASFLRRLRTFEDYGPPRVAWRACRCPGRSGRRASSA